MKILVSIAFYTPNISGLTLHVKQLVEELANSGHSVTVLTTQHEKKLPLHQIIHKVVVHRIPYLFRLSKGFFMPALVYHAVAEVRRADSIIINAPQLEGSIIALIGRIFGKKVYCLYHCEVVLPRGLLASGIQALLFISHFFLLLLSHTVITYTKDYANASFLLSRFKKKLVYNYPPIPKPYIDKNVREKLMRSMPRKVGYHIGIAARISAEKGFEYLFAAIPLLQKELDDDFLILIAGPQPVGEAGYWEKIKPLFDTYHQHVVFLGSIPHEEMGAFYSLLDVLVLSSINKTEAFGIVQVEAMLCGVPVVASDLPGVRQPVMQTSMGEIAKIKNSRDLSEKIAMVLLHQKKYKQEHNEIEKIFSSHHSLQTYKKIFSA